MNALTLTRDGKPVKDRFVELADDRVITGARINRALNAWRPEIRQSDVLIAAGFAHFGCSHTVRLPDCHYLGDSARRPCWKTATRIDATANEAYHLVPAPTATDPNRTEIKRIEGTTYSKDSSTGGFTVGKFAHFQDFDLVGECWNEGEDGGLIGFDKTTPESTLTLLNCLVDGSRSVDWVIYNWTNKRVTIRMEDGEAGFCRGFVTCAASGGGAIQNVTLERVKLRGDANGSHSFGESSANDPLSGGVLTAVLNRKGTTVVRKCYGEVCGLTEPYERGGGKYGCPRIAALGTNQYDKQPGNTEWTFDSNRVKIIPGISEVWCDYDVRDSTAEKRCKVTELYDQEAIAAAEAENAKRLAEARGGSNPDGSLKVWKP